MRFRTRLHVNLEYLRENYQQILKLTNNKRVLFMAKADAYGHGAISLISYAHKELGIREFGLATLGEAKRIRDELPDLACDLFVFSDVHLEYQALYDFYLYRRVFPVISNERDLNFLLNRSEFKNFPLCIKFNTGMNRLGFTMDQVELVVNSLKNHGRTNVKHLMSHLGNSSVDINKDRSAVEQIDNFQKIKKYFQDSKIEIEASSIANSGAIEQSIGLDETHVRPGLIMYGPSSMNIDDRAVSRWRGKNISKLETYVINSFHVKKNERVGYGGNLIPEDGIVALLAIGYGDGFSTKNYKPELAYNGLIGNVVGRVNMDMCLVFFSEEKNSIRKLEKDLQAGASFNLWDHDPKNILDLSDRVNSIPYELFCQLTSRVPRVYGTSI